MGLLSDSRGNVDVVDLGNVSILEAASSTAFFVGASSFVTNFDVQIPMPDGTVKTMADVLASFNFPILGTATFTLGLTLALLLMVIQILDSARSYGRSNSFSVMDWINSIPAGLTIAVALTVALNGAYLFDVASVISFVESNYWYQFGAVVLMTISYFGISSQG
ncbi:hypothetical protein GRX03_01085 [Halovenus sp. WSH3]|uniref:Uncharacterized protein n=1 Tax=Halovenus carboxidivorans TaxID=2692199 RepID=A0A6B0SXX8_9EURY|nr:hypothetical protein [Halovenus carboxidivorans]MXR50205.1 hypothetical protein [Halovenus carboxidivorans]